MNIRRICLYGGPGASKSTTAAGLFYSLKQLAQERPTLSVELVQEYVKTWAYQHKKPAKFDQVYLFSKQLHKESALLNAGVSVVVSDSPVALSVYYSSIKELPAITSGLASIAEVFEEAFPALHVFLARGDRAYKQFGRFETFDTAKAYDQRILRFIGENPKLVPPARFITVQSESAVSQIIDALPSLNLELVQESGAVDAAREANSHTNSK